MYGGQLVVEDETQPALADIKGGGVALDAKARPAMGETPVLLVVNPFQQDLCGFSGNLSGVEMFGVSLAQDLQLHWLALPRLTELVYLALHTRLGKVLQPLGIPGPGLGHEIRDGGECNEVPLRPLYQRP